MRIPVATQRPEAWEELVEVELPAATRANGSLSASVFLLPAGAKGSPHDAPWSLSQAAAITTHIVPQATAYFLHFMELKAQLPQAHCRCVQVGGR